MVKDWLKRAGVEYMEIVPAKINTKLTIKGETSNSPDGRFWSKGIHHVYVDDKPARVYVPGDTLMDTFRSAQRKMKDEGKLKLGIDHLGDEILRDNQILDKMNLLDVGVVERIGMDGDSLYILESSVTDPKIKELHGEGELPAYSVVGSMTAKPCPTDKADYVLDTLNVERIDFVEEGGCQSCTVGATPDTLILTSKKFEEESIMSDDNAKPDTMEEKDSKEVVVVKDEEATKDEVKDEVNLVEGKSDDEAEPAMDSPDKPVVDDAPVAEDNVDEPVESSVEEGLMDMVKTLRDEMKGLKQELGSKKPVIKETETFSPEQEVKNLILEGKATPKMKKGLILLARTDQKEFLEMKAGMPIIVDMKTQGKLAMIEDKGKGTEETDDAAFFESEKFKKACEQFGIKK
jgi:hypothetical protein